jgi:hypothetical protein
MGLNSVLRWIMVGFMVAIFGVIVYHECNCKFITIKVDIEDDANAAIILPQLKSMGRQVVKVKEIDREKNQYELTFRSVHKKESLIDWIMGKKGIEKAE